MLRKLFFLAVIIVMCVAFYRQILEKAQMYVDKHSQSESAPQLQYYIGDVYFISRDFVSAEKAYRLVKKNYPNSFYASRAQYSIARIYEEQDNYIRAKAEYDDFVKNYPQDGFVRKAKNKLEILNLFKEQVPNPDKTKE